MYIYIYVYIYADGRSACEDRTLGPLRGLVALTHSTRQIRLPDLRSAQCIREIGPTRQMSAEGRANVGMGAVVAEQQLA